MRCGGLLRFREAGAVFFADGELCCRRAAFSSGGALRGSGAAVREVLGGWCGDARGSAQFLAIA